jgi:hypothetical protein
MKLSHSAIPTFSPPEFVLPFLFVVVAGVPAGAGAAALVDVSALRFVGAPQASTSRPVRMHTIKSKNLDILILPVCGMEERADNTPCYLFYD